MKKLFSNLLLAAFLTGFVSATSFAKKSKVAVGFIRKANVVATENVRLSQQHSTEIQPLDIFSLRYN